MKQTTYGTRSEQKNGADKKSYSAIDFSQLISEAIGNIDTRYIQEAEQYAPTEKKASSRQLFSHITRFFSHSFARPLFRIAAVAALALCLFFICRQFLSPSGNMSVKVYAQGTDEEISAAGVMFSSSTAGDAPSMTTDGFVPFYLSGHNIAKVRFSCKNEKLEFVDMTEKRVEYGNAQNFVVEYGPDEDEYAFLWFFWNPTNIKENLRTPGSTISRLSEELRNELIVMEITFADGGTATKAISISLKDDGSFFASFNDYKIKKSDAFVRRPDSEPIPREALYAQGSDAPERTEAFMEFIAPLGGAKVAKAEEAVRYYYYYGKEFDVFSTKVMSFSENQITFSVLLTRDGKFQNPGHTITLELQDKGWAVICEGE